MTDGSTEGPTGGRNGGAADVLRAIWATEGQTAAALDAAAESGGSKPCRNMKDVTFDGMAEPGSDLGEAWRERLRREGKLTASGGSIRDLVLGGDSDH